MSDPLLNELVQILRQMLAAGDGPAGLLEPQFGSIERALVNERLDAGRVSSAGGVIKPLAEQSCGCTGVKGATAAVNGTGKASLNDARTWALPAACTSSDASTCLNGKNFIVDGGLTAW